jgi:hypothetical protein
MSSDYEGLKSIMENAKNNPALVVSIPYKQQGRRFYTLSITGNKQDICDVAFLAGRWSKFLGINDINLRVY